MSYQKFIALGNLGRDPELRYTPGGTPVCTVSMAVNRRWKQDGVPKEEVTWLNLEAWGGRAEFLHQYGSKGRKILVEGRIKIDQYEGTDGNTKYFTKIVVSEIQFADSNPNAGENGNAAPAAGPAATPEEVVGDVDF